MSTQPSLPIDLTFLRDRAAIRRIVVVVLVCAVGGVLYGTLAPKWYRPVITIVPASQQKSGISGLLGAQLGGLASAFDAVGGGGADVARIAAVLKSNVVTDAVIEKFDLRARYGEKYQETTRDAVWRHCDVVAIPKPSLVELSCEDKDPQFAQAMLVFFAEYGNQVFRRVGVSSASEEVRFLEKRVSELRQQADEASARMRAFQETHQIVDLDTQARAVVSSMAALHGQRIGKQMELDYARRFSSPDEATARQLESQLSVVDEKLRDLEVPLVDESTREPETRPSRKGKSGVFPVALAVPRLRAEFEALYRDRKVAEATLVYALERLEGAKANQARDVSTFQVLGPPAVPTRRSRPKPLEDLIIAAGAGAILSFAFEWARSLRTRNPGAPPTR